MRGFKLIVAIITIILAFAGVALAAAVGILAFATGSLADQVNDIIGKIINDLFGSGQNTLIILFAAIAVVSVILLILGIRFCSRKPTRFTAVVLFILYMAAAGGLLYLSYTNSDWIYYAVSAFFAVMCLLIIIYLATIRIGTLQEKTQKVKKEKQSKQEQVAEQPRQTAPQPQPVAQPASTDGRVAVTTDSPNFAAKIIRENLKYETIVSGADVFVTTGSQNAQRIADELQKNGVKVSRMRRVS